MNTRLKIGTILAGAALAATTVFSAAAGSTNIVPNGDFSAGVSHWNVAGDGKLQVASGSGELGNVNNKLGVKSTAVAYQCLPVKEGKKYHFFAASYIPGGQERTGEVRWTTAFYPTNNCSGVALDIQQFAPFSATNGQWRTDSGDLVRNNPKTAYSMSVAISVQKDATKLANKGKVFMVRFDNVKVLESTIPVPPAGGGGTDGATVEPTPPAVTPTPVSEDDTPEPATPVVEPEQPVEDSSDAETDDLPGPTVEPAAPAELDPAAIPGVDEPASDGDTATTDAASDDEDEPTAAPGEGTIDTDNPTAGSGHTGTNTVTESLEVPAKTATPAAPSTGESHPAAPADNDTNSQATSDGSGSLLLPLAGLLGAVVCVGSVIGVVLGRRRQSN